MAGYYVVRNKKIGYKYIANLKSGVTIFLLFGIFFSFVLPLIITYNSKGFWIKQLTYREQPLIQFKYEYVIFLEYYDEEFFSHFLMCTTNQALINSKRLSTDHCSSIKVYETDTNNDNKNDEFEMKVEVTNVTNINIISATIILIFDFKVYEECILNLEMMTFHSQQFSHPIGGLQLFGDIQLKNFHPMDCNTWHVKNTNYTILPNNKIFNGSNIEFLNKIISSYRSKTTIINLDNARVSLINKNDVAINEPFTVDFYISYSEQEILYKTKFWQLMKWAWIQYLPVMGIFFFIFKKIKKFVFENGILSTIRVDPIETNV